MHDPDTRVEEVIVNEMERLHKALDIKMSETLEEVFKQKDQPKKK